MLGQQCEILNRAAFNSRVKEHRSVQLVYTLPELRKLTIK
jgi:hypothetical protein